MKRLWSLSWILGIVALGLATLMAPDAVAVSKTNDVFLDDGKGDFGDVPSLPNSSAETRDAAVAPSQGEIAKSFKTSTKKTGMFRHTKMICPIRRKPLETGEEMSTVKAPRKIWVESHDDKWVKVLVKTGEVGYLEVSCLE